MGRRVRENGTIDSCKRSHVKPPAKNPECEVANTPYLKVVGISQDHHLARPRVHAAARLDCPKVVQKMVLT